MNNQRLFLFWPIFFECGDEADPASLSADAPQRATRRFEIRLGWSEYKAGQWLTKRISDAYLTTASEEQLPPRESFRFRGVRLGSDILIDAQRYVDGELVPASRNGWQFCFTPDGRVFFVRYPSPPLAPVNGTHSRFMRLERLEDPHAPFELPAEPTWIAGVSSRPSTTRGRPCCTCRGGCPSRFA